MASTIVQTTGEAAFSRKEAADRLQTNLRLSMKPENSLPQMLMAAPFAISFLGQLRILTFSDSALKISLQKPDKGFEYLKYASLSSAMQQILQQVSQAFDVADSNMSAIENDMKKLFGRSSYVWSTAPVFFELMLILPQAQDILECLNDQSLAQRRLRPLMDKLGTGVKECAEKAKEIEKEFNLVIATSSELNIAMGHQMNLTESQKREANNQVYRALEQETIQENLRASLKQEYERFEKEAKEDRKRFHKTAKGGGKLNPTFWPYNVGYLAYIAAEWKALGLKTVSDAEAGIAGLINGAVGIIREAPRFAIQAVTAAGALGGAASRLMTTGAVPSSSGDQWQDSKEAPDQSARSQFSPATTQASGPKIDPAIASIDRMESTINLVYEMVYEDLLPILLEDGRNQEILSYSEQLKAYKADLGDSPSPQVAKAKVMLDQSIHTADDILQSGNLAGSVHDSSDVKWRKKVEQWRSEMRESHYTAIYLKSVASIQAGQGFGDAALDMVIQAPADPNNTNLDMAGILNARHRKLLIMRAAMQNSRDSLQQTTERYRECQRRAIEISSSLESLKREKVTIEELKKFLRKAIDNLSRLQTEVRQFNQFFDFMSTTISTVMDTVAHRFLENIESGISDGGTDFKISYGQAQSNIIRQTILSIRGQVTFTIESTRLYQGISRSYIQPSMRKAANIPLHCSAEDQDGFAADLHTFTEKCANSILLLATEELKKTDRQFEERLLDLDLAEKGLPAPPEYVEKAIEDGIGDASRQKQDQAKDLDAATKHMEIGDDILG
ncbi:MAG: hypothetical protein Q9204_002081 [Flavoplaca sp. TL-2023a]